MKFVLSPLRVAQGLAVVGVGVSVYAISLTLCASGQKAKCQSNLKLIGLATLQYVRDYDDLFMIAPKWKTALAPYRKFSSQSEFDSSDICPTSGLAYAFNGALGGAWVGLARSPQTLAMFYEPSRAVVTDAGNSWNANGVHKQGSNVCFQDGRVKWLRAKPTFWVPELATKPKQLKQREAMRREFMAQERQRQLKEEQGHPKSTTKH